LYYRTPESSEKVNDDLKREGILERMLWRMLNMETVVKEKRQNFLDTRC